MSGKSKIAEAQFFLNQLRSVEQGTEIFRYYASACASALYGAYQHLLYDYATKFWPHITYDDFLNARLFRLLAKATNRTDALEFVEWYDTLANLIGKNEDASIVWDVRHTETHRAATRNYPINR